MRAIAFVILGVGCSTPQRPFPLREPFLVDTDMRDVSIPCRPDPSPKEPDRKSCAPAEYISPFMWDQIDNLAFARMSRAFAVRRFGESRNVNSLDEVPDSSWFTNRKRVVLAEGESTSASCSTDDLLPPPDQAGGEPWVIDHGKDNGATLGFSIDVPGKGRYLLKADDKGVPERASAASVVGSAIYHSLGFNTSCEQVVVFRKSQLKLTPNLKVVENSGLSHAFDDAALDKVLASTTQVPGGMVRMQASKWLPGMTIGPFRYVGVRDDDPNDVVDHADRRELRGSRVLSAWLDHWDAREQNSMDVWMAADAKNKRSSPGHVVHYFIDTSDIFGGTLRFPEMSVRLGYSYELDFADIGRALFTFGIAEQPWDRAEKVPGREKFAFFKAGDFDPETWKAMYPNPAFLRMTERDAAWMARLIARYSPTDIRRAVDLGKWTDPNDAGYLTDNLVERQRRILARYLTRISPLGDVRADGANQICTIDFARLREVQPSTTYRYTVVQHGGGKHLAIIPELRTGAELCFKPQSVITASVADSDPTRMVTFEVRNGTSAGPLRIHAYDLGGRGMRIVGVTRPE
ncbi:MAG: hypothetical protein ABI867_24235 [Kofleriaceae bacterium]